MPNWLLKAVPQGLLGRLPEPLGQAGNAWLQRNVRKNMTCGPGYFEDRVGHCRKHLKNFQFASRSRVPRTALDLGVGWHPIVPVGLSLCGTERVTAADIRPFLTESNVRRVLVFYKEYAADDRLSRILPDILPERLQLVHRALALPPGTDPLTMLAAVGVDILVCDARQLPHKSESLDLVVSSGTLQHIPKEILEGILGEFRRVLHSNGVMSHWSKLSDIYAAFDRKLSRLNFYRFSAAAWRWVESPFENQNRLRLSDYRRIFEETGFSIVREENETAERKELERVPVHAEFSSYDEESLLTISTWLTAVAR